MAVKCSQETSRFGRLRWLSLLLVLCASLGVTSFGQDPTPNPHRQMMMRSW